MSEPEQPGKAPTCRLLPDAELPGARRGAGTAGGPDRTTLMSPGSMDPMLAAKQQADQ